MSVVKKGPDVAMAAKVGDPTLVDPTPVAANQKIIRTTREAMGMRTGDHSLTVETVKAPELPRPTIRLRGPISASACQQRSFCPVKYYCRSQRTQAGGTGQRIETQWPARSQRINSDSRRSDRRGQQSTCGSARPGQRNPAGQAHSNSLKLRMRTPAPASPPTRIFPAARKRRRRD